MKWETISERVERVCGKGAPFHTQREKLKAGGSTGNSRGFKVKQNNKEPCKEYADRQMSTGDGNNN